MLSDTTVAPTSCKAETADFNLEVISFVHFFFNSVSLALQADVTAVPLNDPAPASLDEL